MWRATWTGYLNDTYNHHFYILSHSEPNITVLDDKDGAILGTIEIGGAPEQAATDGHGRIYVDIVDKAAIAVIDANTMKMIGRYPILSSKGLGCAGLALDAKNGILFGRVPQEEQYGHPVGCRTDISSPDLPIGVGCDGAIFKPRDNGSLQFTGRWHVDRGEGGLAQARVSAWSRTVATPARAKTLTTDTKTNQDFFDYGRVWAGSGRTRTGNPSPTGSPGVDAPPSPANDSTLFPDPCRR